MVNPVTKILPQQANITENKLQKYHIIYSTFFLV